MPYLTWLVSMCTKIKSNILIDLFKTFPKSHFLTQHLRGVAPTTLGGVRCSS